MIAVEFKLGSTWRTDWAKGLHILSVDRSKTIVDRMIVVYTGTTRMQHGAVEVWPVTDFLKELHHGGIF